MHTLKLITLKGTTVTLSFSDDKSVFPYSTSIEGVGEVEFIKNNLSCSGKELKKSPHIKNMGLKVEENATYTSFEVRIGNQFGTILLSEQSTKTYKDYLAAAGAAHLAARREAIEQFENSVEGLKELRAARDEQYNYNAAFARAMENEYQDGAAMPKQPNANVEELKQRYPRAALYLKIESYCAASNYHKAGAGEKAKAAFKAGASIEDINAILDNWSPDEAMWD